VEDNSLIVEAFISSLNLPVSKNVSHYQLSCTCHLCKVRLINAIISKHADRYNLSQVEILFGCLTGPPDKKGDLTILVKQKQHLS